MSNENFFNLNNKVALITGASSGLGRHFARTLATAGASVIIGARRMHKLDAIVDEIEASGGTAYSVMLDILQEHSISNAVTKGLEHFGQIDILVNNAGNVIRKPTLEYTSSEWDTIINTHVKGSWMMTKTVARHMIERGQGGSIINISSAMAVHTRKNALAYATAKAAINHMTRSFAADLVEYDIRVNAIAPGWFVTEINRDFITTNEGQNLLARVPMQRPGNIYELEAPLLLLASDASTYMTGVVIPVDGGYAANML